MIPAMIEIPAIPAPADDVWAWIEALCPGAPEPTDYASDLDWRSIEAAAGIEQSETSSADYGPAGKN